MFYETFRWWGLLTLCIILGFSQQIGAYGRGYISSKIEMTSNLIMFIIFVASFFISGIWGGIFLILLLITINSSITKYIVKKIFRKIIGYVPSDKEKMQNRVVDEYLESGKGLPMLEVDREVRKRLNIKDYAISNLGISLDRSLLKIKNQIFF
ncbi:MAG: hypothetical protein U9O66_03455 [Patescibacteria group bacterium]|nr:hypothetical protein [Patescibacteria group bacterium]